MKRWQLTAGLVAVAGVAALLAPRIQGLTQSPDVQPEIVAPVELEIPEVLDLRESPLHERIVEPPIPELVNEPIQVEQPVTPPVLPKKIDPVFWDDCMGCGMG